MSVLKELFSRQICPSYGSLGSRRWLWKDLETHYQDQITTRGRREGLPIPAFATKFNAEGLHGHLLAVGDEVGSVTLYDTRKLLSDSLVSELYCHTNAIFDICWVAGGNKLLTASGDSSVCLWDVVSGVSLGAFRFHTGSVKSVHSKKDEPSMFVSSCRDGCICVWDTRCSSGVAGHKPANSIASGHSPVGGHPPRKKRRDSLSGGGNACVTAVLFHGDDKIASAGAGDGLVKLWDLRKYQGKHPKAWLSFDPVLTKGRLFGFTSLVADSHQSFLFATCTDNIIYQYSSTGLITRPVGTFSGCKVASFYVKSCLSPDNKYLLSGSSCGNGFIWEIDCPEAQPVLLPSSREVTAVCWCPSMDKLVTSSEGCDVALWRVQRGHSQCTWGVRKCREYAGEEHLQAQQVLKENVAPPTTVATPQPPARTRSLQQKKVQRSTKNPQQSQLKRYFINPSPSN